MFGRKNLIFIMDDDKAFGEMLLGKLRKKGFENVNCFSEELDFINNMDQYPNVVICDYHLAKMNGLQLLSRAKEIHPLFYSILLSGKFHEDQSNYVDPRFIHLIDRYLIKGINEINELIEALD